MWHHIISIWLSNPIACKSDWLPFVFLLDQVYLSHRLLRYLLVFYLKCTLSFFFCIYLSLFEQKLHRFHFSQVDGPGFPISLLEFRLKVMTTYESSKVHHILHDQSLTQSLTYLLKELNTPYAKPHLLQKVRFVSSPWKLNLPSQSFRPISLPYSLLQLSQRKSDCHIWLFEIDTYPISWNGFLCGLQMHPGHRFYLPLWCLSG